MNKDGVKVLIDAERMWRDNNYRIFGSKIPLPSENYTPSITCSYLVLVLT